MEETLKYFLDNTLVNQAAIESRLHHPFTQIKYPNRLVYNLLEKYTNDFFTEGVEPRFVSLAGLRGVGKTTLMWQAAQNIFHQHHQNVYFFNVNALRNLGINLHEALVAFQKHILKKPFHELTSPIALLFDEIHDDENWSKTLKILYDEARTALILCTGSSALLLNSTADLSRRMHTIKVFPYSFAELLQAQKSLQTATEIVVPNTKLSSDLKDALFFSEDASSVLIKLRDLKPEIDEVIHQKNIQISPFIKRYISFQNFPNLLFFKDEIVITNSILDLFKRIIHEDIPKLNDSVADANKIEKLILRLAGSDEINPEKLAGIIGIKQQEISVLMDILAKAELLNVLLPYGGLDTKIAKNKKAFFMSPSLRRALLTTLYGQNIPVQFQSKMIEDIVVMYLKRILNSGVISFITGKNQVNPDLVIETRDSPILLEIGSGKTSLRQITKTNINYRYGLLISNGVDEPNCVSNCIQIPLEWFLLI